MADPPIAMMDCSRTLVLQYPLPAGTDPNSLVPAAARCAETIIRSSGIPVYSGPPWQYVPPPARA